MNVLDEELLFAHNETFQSSNTTIIDTPFLKFTAYLSVAEGFLSFAALSLYVLYVLIRVMYSLPWVHCPLFQQCCFRHRITQSSWRQFLDKTMSECYLFAKPIARIMFFFMFCEFVSGMPITRVYKYAKHTITMPITLCMYDAIASQFFGVANILWSLIIAVWMFWILVLNRGKKLIFLEIGSHLFVWLVSFIMTCVPWAMGVIQPVQGGAYCGISEDSTKGRITLILTFYVSLWFSLFITLILCVITTVYILNKQCIFIRGATRERKLAHIRQSFKLYIKLLGLPLTFLICWSIASVRRFMLLFYQPPNPVPYRFLLFRSMQYIFNSANPFINVCIFFASEIIGVYEAKRSRIIKQNITEE
jgi:hypothetical protein